MSRVPEFPLDPEELNRRLADMHAGYRARVPLKIAVIEALWTQVQACGPADEARVQLMLVTHTMVGSASSLGCESLAVAARNLQGALQTHFVRGESLSEADAAAIGRLVANLGRSLD